MRRDMEVPRTPHKDHIVKTVDEHTHKSAITPLNLEEQKINFLRYGILPTFTLNGTDEELQEIKSKERSKIRFDLLPEAENILNSVKKRYGYGRNFLEKNYGPCIDKDDATSSLTDYLEKNKLTGSMSLVWCKDLASSARMLWCGPSTKVNKPESRRYSFWLKDSPENAYLRKQGILCLADHEIGTHFLRALNDGFQPWYSDRKKFDLNNHSAYELLCTEEGLASIHSTLTSKEKYLWTPALLYYTACKSTEMTFEELFDHLSIFLQDKDQRWKHVMRTKRLLPDVNVPGGYGKDQCYFEGAVSILRDIPNIDFEVLMSGRITKDEISRIKRVSRLNICTFPHFMNDIDQYRIYLHEIAVINGLLEPALPPHLVPRFYDWKDDEDMISSFGGEDDLSEENIYDDYSQYTLRESDEYISEDDLDFELPKKVFPKREEQSPKEVARYHVYTEKNDSNKATSVTAVNVDKSSEMQQKFVSFGSNIEIKYPAVNLDGSGENRDRKLSKTAARLEVDKGLLALAIKLGIAQPKGGSKVSKSECLGVQENTAVHETKSEDLKQRDDCRVKKNVEVIGDGKESEKAKVRGASGETEEKDTVVNATDGFETNNKASNLNHDPKNDVSKTHISTNQKGQFKNVFKPNSNFDMKKANKSNSNIELNPSSPRSHVLFKRTNDTNSNKRDMNVDTPKIEPYMDSMSVPKTMATSESEYTLKNAGCSKSDRRCHFGCVNYNVVQSDTKNKKPINSNASKNQKKWLFRPTSPVLKKSPSVIKKFLADNKIDDVSMCMKMDSMCADVKAKGPKQTRPVSAMSSREYTSRFYKSFQSRGESNQSGAAKDACECSELLRELLHNCMESLDKVSYESLGEISSTSDVKSVLYRLRTECCKALIRCENQQLKQDIKNSRFYMANCKKSVSTQTQKNKKTVARQRLKKRRPQSANRCCDHDPLKKSTSFSSKSLDISRSCDTSRAVSSMTDPMTDSESIAAESRVTKKKRCKKHKVRKSSSVNKKT